MIISTDIIRRSQSLRNGMIVNWRLTSTCMVQMLIINVKRKRRDCWTNNARWCNSNNNSIWWPCILTMWQARCYCSNLTTSHLLWACLWCILLKPLSNLNRICSFNNLKQFKVWNKNKVSTSLEDQAISNQPIHPYKFKSNNPMIDLHMCSLKVFKEVLVARISINYRFRASSAVVPLPKEHSLEVR